MALRFWKPRPRGLKRLTNSGFRFVRGRKSFGGVYHQETPEKWWTTSIFGGKNSKEGVVKDKKVRKIQESKKKDARDLNNFKKGIAELPSVSGKTPYTDRSRVTFHIGEDMTKEDIDELISQHIVEMLSGGGTDSGNIGGFSMPQQGGDIDKKRDIAYGYRNKVAPWQHRNALNYLERTK